MTDALEDMAFISADYEEGKPETFRGYVVEHRGNETRFQTLEEAYSYVETLGVPYAPLSSVEHYEEDKQGIADRSFDEEMTALDKGLDEELAEAEALFERVKDSDDPKLVKPARHAVELANEAKQKAGVARYHGGWNDASRKIVADAKQDNTGCRENIRAVKKLLGE